MTVAVLVPVHGFAPYLAEALDSLLTQEPVPTVVVADDGSPEPISLHADHAGRVKLVRREQSGGPAAARAAAFDALAPGAELVALCDADDAWEPGKLAAQLEALEQTPQAGWAFGRARIVGPDGRATGECWEEPAPGFHDAAATGALLYERNPVPTSSVVIRRGALAAAGGFASHVRLAEDWDLWLRLAAAGQGAVCVPAAVVRYRRHPGGLTADVAALAAAQRSVHTTHAGLAGEPARRRAEAADLEALAAGYARSGRYADARAALAEAAALGAPGTKARVRRIALAIPGARRMLGRRAVYR